MHVSCPHCHATIEVEGDASLGRIECSCCGSGFSLLGEETQSHKHDSNRSISHFELTDRIGMGAFGTVWKARDTTLDRTVAIKIPRADCLGTDQLDQFLREARAAAQVRHPNIVAVHEVGREGDTVYIACDYVHGLTLADWLTGQQPTARQSVELCVKIADALHAAHEAGIIHRDLKPSNILLDIDSEPYITDFGLAKREAGEVTITADGQILGTPAYMSPEQAEGDSRDVDRRCDIYALGVILFETLTGERPFRGNPRMLLHQVIHDEPPSPRKLNSTVPKDLETICLKCLEKDAEKRYSTAIEFAEELKRFSRGEPIVARPLGPFGKAWRRCRRNPVVSGLALACVVAVATGLIGTTLALKREQAALSKEQSALLKEQEVTTQQARQLYFSRINLAYEALNSGDKNAFDDLMAELREESEGEYCRGFEWQYLLAREAEMNDVLRIGAPSTVLALSFSPSGTLAIAGADGNNYLCDLGADGKQIKKIAMNGGAIGFSPKGNYLVANADMHSPLESLVKAHRIRRFPSLNPIGSEWVFDSNYRINFGPNENRIAITHPEEGVTIRHFPDATLELQLDLQQGIRSAFSPDGRRLATIGADHVLRLFDCDDGSLLDTIEQSITSGYRDAENIKFSPNGKHVILHGHHGARLYKSNDSTLRIMDWQLNTETYSATFATNGLLATGSSDQTVRIWQLDDLNHPLATLINPSMVTSVAFTHDSRRLSAGCRGGDIMIWEAHHWTTPLLSSSPAHFHPPFDVLANRAVLSNREGGGEILQLVNLRNGNESSPEMLPRRSQGNILVAAFSPDGEYVACGDANGHLTIWEIGKKDPIVDIELIDIKEVTAICFSGSGHVAVGGIDGFQVSKNVRTIETPLFKRDSPKGIVAMGFAPNGTLAVGGRTDSSTDSGQLLVLDPTSSEIVFEDSTREWTRDVAFSPDGSLLAYISEFSSGVVRVVETDDWSTVHSDLRCHSGKSTRLAFAGSRLVTGSDNNAIRFWDTDYGVLLGTIKVRGKVRGLKTLPDNQGFWTMSRRGALRFWDAQIQNAD